MKTVNTTFCSRNRNALDMQNQTIHWSGLNENVTDENARKVVRTDNGTHKTGGIIAASGQVMASH